jgi:sulfur-oxidizing protein SoxZ
MIGDAFFSVPPRAKRGQVVEIKTLIAHPMETGYRPDYSGKLIPRDIINKLVCVYNGVEVFRADLHPAISANPFVTFCAVATESGVLEFTWTDDAGGIYVQMAQITVE